MNKEKLLNEIEDLQIEVLKLYVKVQSELNELADLCNLIEEIEVLDHEYDKKK